MKLEGKKAMSQVQHPVLVKRLHHHLLKKVRM